MTGATEPESEAKASAPCRRPLVSRVPRAGAARFGLAILGLLAAGSGMGQEPLQRPGPPGTIKGRVDARGVFAPEGSPRVADLGMGAARDFPDRRQSVVYLESAPQGAFEDRAGRAVMGQLDETFVPYVLPIMVGSTVDFPNQDRTYHNVFSLSRVKS